MKKIELAGQSQCCTIVLDNECAPGIKRIAGKLADDFKMVTGKRPEVASEIVPVRQVVFIGTLGSSVWLEQWGQQKKLDIEAVQGKREVFGIKIVDHPWDGTDQALVIYGSDKRGTIYGIFHLSELIGVSPLVYWGDAKPQFRERIVLVQSVEMIAKEPSVRYRGFFINDEWPCFGNWTMNHFGGFTADMYDHVFELLLRLKGNYLWPAMWSSSFALDGPDEESARLADEYGVIIGSSHHEPCMRASEEWDRYKGENTPYHTAWDYTINKEGLLKYWEDGLKRSGKYESIITMGMRGERDSTMQGTNSLQENIEILKDIITCQQQLVERYARSENGEKRPELLAIYKEVEQYFEGNENVVGLRDWEGLKDIILMYCEDNYGNMRTLPDEQIRGHKAGFGMYYHLDYHGSPVSYEWINTTPLTKIWEQMTEAYEYGIREVWMVNVGDLKGNEFPLSYFMELAYDYENWGGQAVNSTDRFKYEWVRRQFGEAVEDELVTEAAQLLTESVNLLSICRPEALKASTYSPFSYGEADRIAKKAGNLSTRADLLLHKLTGVSRKACKSMLWFPLQRGMNLLLMQIYAGKNAHFAKQGKNIANHYHDLVAENLEKDRTLSDKLGLAFQEKWRGMELGAHIGFTKWNEDGCQNPLRITVEPLDHAQMIVSRADREEIAVKNYAGPEQIEIVDFCYPESERVEIEVANGGKDSFFCQVEQEPCDWITVSWKKKEIREQEVLILTCRRPYLPIVEAIHKIILTDGDGQCRVELLVHGKKTVLNRKLLEILREQRTEMSERIESTERTERSERIESSDRADWAERIERTERSDVLRKDEEQLRKKNHQKENVFLEGMDGFVIKAEHYTDLKNGSGGEWKVLKGYGKTGAGLKAFPVTETFSMGKGPVVQYQCVAEHTGRYTLEVWSAPANPLRHGGRLCFGLKLNRGPVQKIPTVGADYEGGEPENLEWSLGVVNQIHKCKIPVELVSGINTIDIYSIDPGFVLQELLLYRKAPQPSCLGPQESARLQGCLKLGSVVK